MPQVYRDLVLEYGGWVAVAGLVMIFGAFMAYQNRGIMRRKDHLRRRQEMGESEWFEIFYPVAVEKRGHVRDVLAAFAEDIGIEWTQFRPSDRFEQVLRVAARYSPIDDLEEAGLEIASLAEKLGVVDQELPGFTGSLKNFLDRWVKLCGGEPPGKPKMNEAC